MMFQFPCVAVTWECCWMASKFFGCLKFWGYPLIYLYKKLHIKKKIHFLFNMYDSSYYGKFVHNILKRGGGTPCTIFCRFCDFKFFCKMIYVKQLRWGKGNRVGSRVGRPHHHDLEIWGGMSYISYAKRKVNMMWIFLGYWKTYCIRTYHWHYMLEIRM